MKDSDRDFGLDWVDWLVLMVGVLVFILSGGGFARPLFW